MEARPRRGRPQLYSTEGGSPPPLNRGDMMNRPRLPLGDYFQLLIRNGLLADKAPLKADLTHPVSLVSCDSRVVVPNTLFVCKGAAF